MARVVIPALPLASLETLGTLLTTLRLSSHRTRRIIIDPPHRVVVGSKEDDVHRTVSGMQ